MGWGRREIGKLEKAVMMMMVVAVAVLMVGRT